ncbi:MAG: serine hydroxymethyltransferase [Cellvibrionaceae bacterium]
MSAAVTDYLSYLKTSDPAIHNALLGEEERQRDGIELIPAENYTYPEVLALLGSVFTNKYSEGYPGNRYYGGQAFTDTVENTARRRACELFRAEYANVQPLSGSAMNQAVYFGLLEPGDTILAMDLSHGGHLTHGAPVSHMGKLFNFIRYKTDPVSGDIDFEQLRELARKHRPKLVLCGYSSYPRDLDYSQFKAVGDEVGALTMADVSHIGGLVAGGAMNNPLDAGFDVMTTTTHKSLRGPRGGLILCKQALGKQIDKSVFPGLQGGPHMNQVAATATTLLLASTPAFKEYCRQVMNNAQTLARCFGEADFKLVTGGTANHLLVIDTVTSVGLTGKECERILDEVGITTNKQVIPDDPLPPVTASGIRVGTPAPTTRGMVADDMEKIAVWMIDALKAHDNKSRLIQIGEEVKQFCRQFPVPGL